MVFAMVSLAYGRCLLAPLTGNKEGSMWLTVLGVRPTPTRLPTDILYTWADMLNLSALRQTVSPHKLPTDGESLSQALHNAFA